MALVKIAEFDGIDLGNIKLDEDVLYSFKALSKNDIVKVFTVLGTLNEHGLSYEFFRNRLEKLSGRYSKIFELKVKSLARREWRFLVIPLNNNGNQEYAILHSFLKQSDKIKESDKRKAYSVAKREGLL